MRRIANAVLCAIALVAGLLASAQQTQTVSPKLRGIVDSMKAYAESKPQYMNRTPQGNFYFKWLMSPPPGFDKAYFKLGELNKGTKFLSLQLIRKTPAGVELTVLNDIDMNNVVEEAFKATGKNLQEADKAIGMAADKTRLAVTPEMAQNWAVMIDELRWELKDKD